MATRPAEDERIRNVECSGDSEVLTEMDVVAADSLRRAKCVGEQLL